MSPEEYQRVQELFLRVLEVEESNRETVLCDSSESALVQGEVRAMLRHQQEDGLFGEESLAQRRDLITNAFDSELDPRSRLFGDLTFLPEKLPERVGGCRIDSILGEGGGGTVFRAFDESGEEVALKVLRALDPRSQIARRFQREIRILDQLDHPGIVRVRGSGVDLFHTGVESVSLPWFVMDLVPGRPLGSWASEESPSWPERVRVMIEVLEALDYAHGKAILHRDLKPQNLMVTPGGRAVILDFGTAAVRRLGSDSESVLTVTGQILGTMAYMSPEQASGLNEGVDGRADLYSVGAILYELASGRTPYDLRKLSLIACLKKLRFEEPTPLNALVPDLAPADREIIERALAAEPKDRPADAIEFAQALRRLLS